jgi:hypothetical protein
MKNRILFISLAVVLALSLGLVGCGGVTPPTAIKVGLARDLNGLLDVFECGYGGSTYRWFANKVNDDGGITLSELGLTLPIELVVRDFDLATWDLADVTEGLIDDGCDFIWGGPGTDCIFTQAPVCNAAGVVLITLEGGASSMIWSGDIDSWPYVWATLSFSNWYQIPYVHSILDAQTLPGGDRDPIAYMTYIGGPGTTHGAEYRDETETVFGVGNTIDAGFHSYDLFADGGVEAAAIIAAAAAALGSPANPNYDIFCAYTYPWNVAALTLALMASTFDPPAILFGPGANGQDYNFNFGPYTNGILAFVVATNETSPEMADLFDGIAAQIEDDWDNTALPCAPGISGQNVTMTSGLQMIDYWGMPCYAAGLELWQKAVVAAGNLDSSDVRDALASLNTTTVLGANTYFHVFGGGYGGGILDYMCHPGEIGQWQSGVYKIVGGQDTTGTFAYPYTGSWFWLLD